MASRPKFRLTRRESAALVAEQLLEVDHVHLAGIRAAVGDSDKAVAALAQACEDRSARVSTPRFYPSLTPLFDDPRFAALEEKVAHSAISSK